MGVSAFPPFPPLRGTGLKVVLFSLSPSVEHGIPFLKTFATFPLGHGPFFLTNGGLFRSWRTYMGGFFPPQRRCLPLEKAPFEAGNRPSSKSCIVFRNRSVSGISFLRRFSSGGSIPLSWDAQPLLFFLTARGVCLRQSPTNRASLEDVICPVVSLLKECFPWVKSVFFPSGVRFWKPLCHTLHYPEGL